MRKYIDSDNNINKLGINSTNIYDIMILDIQNENGTIPENIDIFVDKSILNTAYRDKYNILHSIREAKIIKVVNDYIKNIEIIPIRIGIISDITLFKGDIEICSKKSIDKSMILQCKFDRDSSDFNFNFLIVSIIKDGFYYPISTLQINPEKVNSFKHHFEINYKLEFEKESL